MRLIFKSNGAGAHSKGNPSPQEYLLRGAVRRQAASPYFWVPKLFWKILRKFNVSLLFIVIWMKNNRYQR
jgi:hypothetical protein